MPKRTNDRLKELHGRLRSKKLEASEIKKAFKDELANNPHYQQLTEQMAMLREEKKSIENQTWASASADAQKLDLLTLDIKADKEQLADVALDMYAKGETVEIIDEYNRRWDPKFSVAFKKNDDPVPPEERV